MPPEQECDIFALSVFLATVPMAAHIVINFGQLIGGSQNLQKNL
jgi:hypothetical protein